MKYIFCNKPFKAFLDGQMPKVKPTPLLTIKMYYFDVADCHAFHMKSASVTTSC